MTAWSTTTKHQPSEINNGNKYSVDDNVSLEELNATVENSLYAIDVAEHTVVDFTEVTEGVGGVNPLDNYYTKSQTQNLISNPNLLINGDFRVNQRGKSVYSFSTTTAYTRTYTVDRWRFVNQVANSTSTVTVNSDSISVYCANQYDNISQLIEDYDKFAGKTVTASCKIKAVSGTGFAFRINVDGTQVGYKALNTAGVYSFTITLPSTINSSLQFSIVESSSTAGKTIEIEWCKLELGSIATPFSPRPYAEELAMCQRYYVKLQPQSTYQAFGVGVCSSQTTAQIILPLPTTMRMTGTVTLNGNFRFYTSGNFTYSATSPTLSNQGKSTNCQYISFTWSNNQLTAGQSILFRAESGSIELDAEIY